MAMYVIDPEAVIAFRRNHRRTVQRQRKVARNKQIAKPQDRKQYDELDRQWLRAVERDRS